MSDAKYLFIHELLVFYIHIGHTDRLLKEHMSLTVCYGALQTYSLS